MGTREPGRYVSVVVDATSDTDRGPYAISVRTIIMDQASESVPYRVTSPIGDKMYTRTIMLWVCPDMTYHLYSSDVFVSGGSVWASPDDDTPYAMGHDLLVDMIHSALSAVYPLRYDRWCSGQLIMDYEGIADDER